MVKNIWAYTLPMEEGTYYPEYISVNETEKDKVKICIRNSQDVFWQSNDDYLVNPVSVSENCIKLKAK